MVPGEFIAGSSEVIINEGYAVKTISVKNTGDRPIQVGSHFHFFEANRFLSFDRSEAFGYRLDIPSGTAVRFEPGDTKEVQLVEIAGNKRINGLNSLTDAQAVPATLNASLKKAELKNFIY